MSENRLVVQKVLVDWATGEIIAEPGDVLDYELLNRIAYIHAAGALKTFNSHKELTEYLEREA